ncbi:Rv3235 family protein [Actinomyces qiguomingii]|uniref:Rv3235 family protein n=1 Tax=Actinomyces qiguomingii TaxID=2057800 RepID=UPI001E49E680|nr:Rv3235 family protein [Actinomyces qiguomingii]
MSATAVTAQPSRSATSAPTEPDRRSESRPARSRRRTGPTPPSGPIPTRRQATGSTAGAVEHRPSVDGAQRPRQWDRMSFRPALRKADGRVRDLARPDDLTSGSSATGAQRTAAMPDPARFAAVVVTAAAEVLSGQRRADNLARWTTPELFAALARRAGLARRLLGQAPATRPRPRSVHAQQPDNGCCEVTILLDDGDRVRAAAARLEAFRGRWLLAALEIA